MHLPGAETERIDEPDRIIFDVDIKINSTIKSDRILTNEAASIRRIISGTVVVKTCFTVGLPPGIKIWIGDRPGRRCQLTEPIVGIRVRNAAC